MSTLALAPVQWAQFKDVEEVVPLNNGDAVCLSEVRDVLKRHDKLCRFGVALLHSHLALKTGEVLLESTDFENRRLITEPVLESDASAEGIGTIWALQDSGDFVTMTWCRQYCARGIFGHSRAHQKAR